MRRKTPNTVQDALSTFFSSVFILSLPCLSIYSTRNHNGNDAFSIIQPQVSTTFFTDNWTFSGFTITPLLFFSMLSVIDDGEGRFNYADNVNDLKRSQQTRNPEKGWYRIGDLICPQDPSAASQRSQINQNRFRKEADD